MAIITYGASTPSSGKTLNAKARRHLKRRKEALKRLQAQKDESELSQMPYTERKAQLASEIPPPKDDLVLPQDKKDDAFFKVVNHAHQRSPDKKW